MPKIPLLPLWEKGAGGRGAKAHGNPEHQHDQAVAQTGCVVGQRRSTKIAPESRANVACRWRRCIRRWWVTWRMRRLSRGI